jgi:hypothetical protein
MARPKQRLQPLRRSSKKTVPKIEMVLKKGFEKKFWSKKITAPHITKLKNTKNRSFRAEQTGCFLLLRSCEVAGLRSRGISLRFIRHNTAAPPRRSTTNQLPHKSK